LPNGDIVPDYYYWEGGDFALVFATTDIGEILLTRQYKHGVKETVVELPAGLLNEGVETALEAAQRELREETGYTGGRWIALGQLNVSSAKATTRANVFLAEGVRKTAAPRLDPHEGIEVFPVKIAKLIELIRRGDIRDATSIATTFLALEVLGRV
jgi:ADP-ribose diphosphatase